MYTYMCIYTYIYIYMYCRAQAKPCSPVVLERSNSAPGGRPRFWTRQVITPGLRYNISIFSDPAPGKS